MPAPKVRFATENAPPKIRAIGQRWAPHEDVYHHILTCSWLTFFGLVSCAFITLNALFALAYLANPESVSQARAGSFEDAFFFSVQTMGTIGYGGMAPVTRWAHAIVTLEALTGIFFTALVTGATFAKFARPRARVLFSAKAVIGPRNGVPHLMFRMANWRHNQIVEAQLRVLILLTETTREGEVMRRPVTVHLVRSTTAFFALTFTAMHEIDEKSPFFGADALDKLREQGAEIYLGLTGTDETIGQTIHARCRYSLDQIVKNARFADVLTVAEDGTRVIDYHRFHDVIPLEIAPSGVAEGAPMP